MAFISIKKCIEPQEPYFDSVQAASNSFLHLPPLSSCWNVLCKISLFQRLRNLEASVCEHSKQIYVWLWKRLLCKSNKNVVMGCHCYNITVLSGHACIENLTWNQNALEFCSLATWFKSLSSEHLSKWEIYLFSQQNLLKPDKVLIRTRTNPFKVRLRCNDGIKMRNEECWEKNMVRGFSQLKDFHRQSSVTGPGTVPWVFNRVKTSRLEKSTLPQLLKQAGLDGRLSKVEG